jgi:hypothetical protein
MSTPSLAEIAAQDQTQDEALTIALAEYSALSDLQRSMREQSAARFNFFLAVATAVAAVTAGLLSGAGPSGMSLGAISTLGVLLLVMGVSIFLRQIEFAQRGQRYAAAHDALRTYLVGRAPELRPYLFLPTLTDRGVIGSRYRTHGWRRDMVSLAGTVALFNSALLALATGLLVGGNVSGWPPAAGAVAVFAVATVIQIRYIQRAGRRTHNEIAELVEQRGLGEQASVPHDGGGVGE